MRVVIALLLGTVMLAGCDRQEAAAPQANATNSAAAVSPDEVPATPGGSAATPAYVVDRSHKGEAAPEAAFTDAKGGKTSLQALAGKPMLVNLWATWCGPCVAEMPQLDSVAAAKAASGLQILAVSQDSKADAAPPFFARKGFKNLKLFLDTDNALMGHFSAGTLPTTIIYDGKGKEVARVTGPMDWTGKEAEGLIAEAVAA